MVVFVALVYQQESWLIGILAQEPSGIQKAIEEFLLAKQLMLLPGKAWLLAWPLGLAALAYLIFNRGRWYFLALAGWFSFLILLADRLYYHYFSSVITTSTMKAIHQTWDIRSSLWAVLPVSELLLSLVFALFGLFGFLQNRWVRISLKESPNFFLTEKTLGLFLVILSAHSAYLAYYIPNRHVSFDFQRNLTIHDEKPEGAVGLVPKYQSSHRDFAVTFGVFNFHLYDLISSLNGSFNKTEVGPQELKKLVTLFNRKQELNQTTSPFSGLARGKNLFLVSLESFQYFLVDLEVDGEPVTPTLNRLYRNSLGFHQIIDQSKLGGTADAEFSLMTGLLPDVRTIASLKAPSQQQLLALPDALRKKGYGTYSFHGYRLSFWNRNINHPLYGFQEMFFEEAFHSQEVIGLGLPDRDFFLQSLDILANKQTPFLAFLIGLSSHHPYVNVPEAYAELFPSMPRSSEARRYLQLARYTDDALAELLANLQASGMGSNSLLVIYGDHIAPMGQPGVEDMLQTTGISIREPRALRIPLVIHAPGHESFFQTEGPPFQNVAGGLQDIFPTLLHLIGEDVPKGVYGTHLFVKNPLRDPVPVLRKGGHFVFKGQMYQGAQGTPVKDGEGLVFGDSQEPQPNPSTRQSAFQSAVRDLTLHFLLFDGRAQKPAIQGATESQ